MVEHGDEHGGHGAERRASLLVESTQHRLGIEPCARIDRRQPMHDAKQAPEYHSPGVIQRQRDAQAVPWYDRHPLAGEERIVENVVVGKRCGLWRASGAGSELDVDRVVWL